MPPSPKSPTVRRAVLLRLVGRAALPVALVLAVPALFALGAKDFLFAARAAIPAALSLAIWLLFRGRGPLDVQRHELRVVAVLAFVLVPLAAMAPFTSYPRLTRIDAIFEALAALTTTGLSMMSPDGAAPALLFARAWLAWIGGLAIVLLATVFLATRGPEQTGLADGEADALDRGSAIRAVRRIAIAYAALTALLTTAMMATGLAPLTALLYATSSISTYGASPVAGGIAVQNPAAQLLAIGGAVLGSLPLLWLGFGLRGPAARLAALQVFVGLAVALLVTGLLVFAMGYFHELPLATRLWRAPLLALAAQSSTGFEASPVVALDQGSKLALCLGMFVGGATGSAASGFRTLRLLYVLAALRRFVLRSSLRSGELVGMRVAGVPVDDAVLRRVLVVGLLFTATIALSWLPFVLLGRAPLDALVEVVSATCNCGLSTGITRPSLPLPLKLVLAADMLLGRFEFLAVLVAVYPGTWIGNWRARALRALDARGEG